MKIKKLLVIALAAIMIAGCGKDSAKDSGKSSSSGKTSTSSSVDSGSSSENESNAAKDSESSAKDDESSSKKDDESSVKDDSESSAEPDESSSDENSTDESSSEPDGGETDPTDITGEPMPTPKPEPVGFETSEAFFKNWKALMKKYYTYEKLMYFFDGDEEKMDEISAEAAEDVFRLINANELKAACEFMKKAGLFDGSEDDFVALIKKDLAKDAKESLKYATEYLLVEDEAMSAMTLNEVFTTWEFPEKAFHEWNLDEFFEEYSENEISQVLKELGLEGVIETDGLELLPEDSDDKSIGFDFVDDDIAIAKYDGKWYFSVFAI
ncbi:MAG: hypothetical protein IJM14_06260 [Lachnospiraceae bacterium]|nr:hypothetical protein [Lachnospiraceae bacterium]